MKFGGGMLALALLCAPLMADRIDVTSWASAVVSHEGDLFAYFGIWTYGRNNPGASPYPTNIGFLAMGEPLPPASMARLPNTTVEYFEDYLFEGYLESLDGSISVPLVDPGSSRLGLPPGLLLATSGTYTGSGAAAIPVAVVSGSLAARHLPVGLRGRRSPRGCPTGHSGRAADHFGIRDCICEFTYLAKP